MGSRVRFPPRLLFYFFSFFLLTLAGQTDIVQMSGRGNHKQTKENKMTRLPVTYVDAGSQDNGRTFEVEAQTADGRRFHLLGTDVLRSYDQADRLVDRIREAGSIDLDHWVEGFSVYGSAAFLADEGEAALHAEAVRGGEATLDTVPDSLRSLL